MSKHQIQDKMPKKIKTCIVGNMKVGKTSIIVRIFENTFTEGTVPTIGMDYRAKKQTIKNKECLVELWDTTGQQKFKTVVANFFRQADGVFIVFDITDDKSVEQAEYWLKELDKYLSEDVPRILLANKTDLKSQLSEIGSKKVKEYCEKYNLAFFKVSAKKNTNIKEAYESLIEAAYENVKKKQKQQEKQSIFINKQIHESCVQVKKKKKGCC